MIPARGFALLACFALPACQAPGPVVSAPLLLSPVQSIAINPNPPPITVRSWDDLKHALTDANGNCVGPVDVFIPAGVDIDCTGKPQLPLCTGARVEGTRGNLDEGAILHKDDINDPYDSIFGIFGGVVVQGLRFRGPASLADATTPGLTAIGVYTGAGPTYAQVLIEDSEFFNWTNAGIEVTGSLPVYRDHSIAEAASFLIRHNYFHHNVRDGLGYGVAVDTGAYATIEGNVFDYNRHAITQDDSPGGYVARYNYVLEGGHKVNAWDVHDLSGQGIAAYYNQIFDVHGTADGSHHDGGTAGQSFDVGFNTIRGDQTYDGGKTRRAFIVRGQPSDQALFHDNVLQHPNETAALEVIVNNCHTVSIPGCAPSFLNPCTTVACDPSHVSAYDNTYDADRAGEVAVADLDGDGLDDVFLPTGTSWFYSSAGQTEWRFLNATPERLADVALGQFDGDALADVLTVKNGRFYISTGGRGPFQPIGVVTDSPPIGQLRFGNFDDNGKTDVLRSDGNLWWVSYDARGPWVPLTQAQGLPLSDLRFADLDGDHKTDVFRIGADAWYWKRDGIGGWLRLGDKQWSNVADLTFADFDGDGRADIALLGAGGRWGYWSGGSSAVFTPLHAPSGDEATGVPLAIGHFEAFLGLKPTTASVLGWGPKRLSPYNASGDEGSAFVFSAQGGTPYFQWSQHAMQ
jgi:hypothetical protein